MLNSWIVLSEFNDIKEIIFYQSHKHLSKDLREILVQHFMSGLPSEWAIFESVLRETKELPGSRVRHLQAYFSELAPKWNEYVAILNTMTELYRKASATPDAFKFQLDHVENCWKNNDHPLSWSNIKAIEEVGSAASSFCLWFAEGNTSLSTFKYRVFQWNHNAKKAIPSFQSYISLTVEVSGCQS